MSKFKFQMSMLVVLLFLGAIGGSVVCAGSDLVADFIQPPASFRPQVSWWWTNGSASKESITRELEEMKKQGLGGALIFNFAISGQPTGAAFMSPEWREIFKHALVESDRLGLDLSVNLSVAYDCGGPWVAAEHATNKLVSSQTVIHGPERVGAVLPKPPITGGYYQDIAVLAVPIPARDIPPDPSSLWNSRQAVDVTRFLDSEGKLNWDVPAGHWRVLRIGSTLHGKRCGEVCGTGPLEIDPMSREAMDFHFAQSGAKLIADAGPLAGKTLQYFHIDSWELGQPTWTPRMREEFTARRGYDPLLSLPAVLGLTLDDAATTARFMQDYRRTVADLLSVEPS